VRRDGLAAVEVALLAEVSTPASRAAARARAGWHRVYLDRRVRVTDLLPAGRRPRLAARGRVVGLLGVLLLAACGPAAPTGGTSSTAVAASPGSGGVPADPGSACHEVGGLPDPACTPGASDPGVNQDNIAITICVAGWTATVRPPSSYTTPLKALGIDAYGYVDRNLADYEEDHLVPLELGGAPRDPQNLWPQPRYGAHRASDKDIVENRLHADVCAGRVALAAARANIAHDWVDA
jgi:hypothetical protein